MKSTDCSLLLTSNHFPNSFISLVLEKWNVPPNSDYSRVSFYWEIFSSNEISAYGCQRPLKSSCVFISKVKMGFLIFRANLLTTLLLKVT